MYKKKRIALRTKVNVSKGSLKPENGNFNHNTVWTTVWGKINYKSINSAGQPAKIAYRARILCTRPWLNVIRKFVI